MLDNVGGDTKLRRDKLQRRFEALQNRADALGRAGIEAIGRFETPGPDRGRESNRSIKPPGIELNRAARGDTGGDAQRAVR